MKKGCIILLLISLLSFCGCGMLSSEDVKLRDLEFTVLGEEKVPEELKKIIEEKKELPYELTYSDAEALYICVGYGKQETGGYSVTVTDLYLTEDAIHVSTDLLGPDAKEKEEKTPSYPHIVIKTEKLEETVICD